DRRRSAHEMAQRGDRRLRGRWGAVTFRLALLRSLLAVLGRGTAVAVSLSLLVVLFRRGSITAGGGIAFILIRAGVLRISIFAAALSRFAVLASRAFLALLRRFAALAFLLAIVTAAIGRILLALRIVRAGPTLTLAGTVALQSVLRGVALRRFAGREIEQRVFRIRPRQHGSDAEQRHDEQASRRQPNAGHRRWHLQFALP